MAERSEDESQGRGPNGQVSAANQEWEAVPSTHPVQLSAESPGTLLDRPVVGLVGQGQGYYLMVAADGGIFSFGQSVFHGSIPGLADPDALVQSSDQETVAVMVRSDSSGYIMLSRNGQNPIGSMAPTILDTAAFATCP